MRSTAGGGTGGWGGSLDLLGGFGGGKTPSAFKRGQWEGHTRSGGQRVLRYQRAHEWRQQWLATLPQQPHTAVGIPAPPRHPPEVMLFSTSAICRTIHCSMPPSCSDWHRGTGDGRGEGGEGSW